MEGGGEVNGGWRRGEWRVERRVEGGGEESGGWRRGEWRVEGRGVEWRVGEGEWMVT